jgi:hypothetical protein
MIIPLFCRFQVSTIIHSKEKRMLLWSISVQRLEALGGFSEKK